MNFSKSFRVAAIAALLFLPIQAPAQAVAIAVGVDEGAIVETAGTRRALARRDEISVGDIIVTDATGTVQLVFQDRTRMVVGPNARFLVRNIVPSGNRRASTFAVEAVSGAYRFISGNSPSGVYRIDTPTTTLGVRGTRFDFSSGETATGVVTFSGRVQMCAADTCATVRGSCTAAIGGSGGIAQLRGDTKNEFLEASFPLIVSQGKLGAAFRSRTEDCGRVAQVPAVRRGSEDEDGTREDVAPPPPPAPDPEVDPEPEPEPEEGGEDDDAEEEEEVEEEVEEAVDEGEAIAGPD